MLFILLSGRCAIKMSSKVLQTDSYLYIRSTLLQKQIVCELVVLIGCFCCIYQDMLPSRMEKPVGKVTVPCNPASLEAVTVEPLTVPSESFFMNGTMAATNSYYLRFCVRRLSSGNVRQTRGRDSSSDLGMMTV